MDKGITRVADNISLMARDTRKKLNIFCSFFSIRTDMQTRIFPHKAMTTMLKRQSTGQLYSCGLDGSALSLLLLTVYPWYVLFSSSSGTTPCEPSTTLVFVMVWPTACRIDQKPSKTKFESFTGERGRERISSVSSENGPSVDVGTFPFWNKCFSETSRCFFPFNT